MIQNIDFQPFIFEILGDSIWKRFHSSMIRIRNMIVPNIVDLIRYGTTSLPDTGCFLIIILYKTDIHQN